MSGTCMACKGNFPVFVATCNSTFLTEGRVVEKISETPEICTFLISPRGKENLSMSSTTIEADDPKSWNMTTGFFSFVCGLMTQTLSDNINVSLIEVP